MYAMVLAQVVAAVLSWFAACSLVAVVAAMVDWSQVLEARLARVKATSIEQLRQEAVSNCTRTYEKAEFLRAVELDFLLSMKVESAEHMEQIQEQLNALGVSAKERSDLEFLQEVTLGEVENMVSENVMLTDEFLFFTMDTCRQLDELTSAQLEDVKNEFKRLSFEVKTKIFVTVTQMSDMLLEFYDFVKDLMLDSDLHELVYAVESHFEELIHMLHDHKTRVLGARRKMLAAKATLTRTFDDLSYKLEKKQT